MFFIIYLYMSIVATGYLEKGKEERDADHKLWGAQILLADKCSHHHRHHLGNRYYYACTAHFRHPDSCHPHITQEIDNYFYTHSIDATTEATQVCNLAAI